MQCVIETSGIFLLKCMTWKHQTNPKLRDILENKLKNVKVINMDGRKTKGTCFRLKEIKDA